jgi:hypothetical protein
MTTETVTGWCSRGHDALHPVLAAERQLSAALHLNHVVILAAADQLFAATDAASAWLAANPCPDSELEIQMARVLNNCSEVARTAQRLATNPLTNTEAARRRIENLAAVIRVDAQALEEW